MMATIEPLVRNALQREAPKLAADEKAHRAVLILIDHGLRPVLAMLDPDCDRWPRV